MNRSNSDDNLPAPQDCPWATAGLQNDDDWTPSHPLLGTAVLLGAGVLACLCFAHETTGLPFKMPVFWYDNRPLWYGFTLGGFVVGCHLLWSRRRFSDPWKPARPGVRFQSVVLYTKQDCHLCDHAKDALLKYRPYLPQIQEVDITADPRLFERFGTCIPVVEIDGRVRFRGRVNEVLLRRLIEAAPPSGPFSS